jgi:hypothetical protein
MAVTLYVGAEGCAETEGVPWIREPTEEEIADFLKRYPDVSSIDRFGRPYWLRTVTDDAPSHVLDYVRPRIRVLRVI